MPSGIASCGTTEGQYAHLRLVTMRGGAFVLTVLAPHTIVQ